MFELTRAMVDGLPRNGPTDPIEYYRRPVIGRLFRGRINAGLRLLPARRFPRALEVGYGAGAVQLALAGGVDELHGVDLDAEPGPVAELLAARGCAATLAKGNVCGLQYGDASFELVVCFSVFEHLERFDLALAEVARVLRPGGLFVLGMPSVNRFMEAAFFAIGFKGIHDHHVTTPAAVAARFGDAGFAVVASSGLDALPGARLYHTWLLEKRAGS